MNYGLVVAAGAGTRFGGLKQFARLAGKPLIWYSLRAFERCPTVKEVVLVTNIEMIDRAETLIRRWRFHKVTWVVAGGEQRQDSVARGLRVLPDKGMVAIHDGARPFLTPVRIADGFRAGQRAKAVIYGMPVLDTVKEIADCSSPQPEWSPTADRLPLPARSLPDSSSPRPSPQRGEGECGFAETGVVARTIPRANLILVQTPQFYDLALIKDAYRHAQQDGFYATDDAQLVERRGYPVKVLKGWPENVKITTRADLALAASLKSR